MFQCEFITGSDAQGCMIILVSEHKNITTNLTRDSSFTTITVRFNTFQRLLCNPKVFGYDIESDGSIGSLAVPGIISVNLSQNLTDYVCMPIVIQTSSCELKYLRQPESLG